MAPFQLANGASRTLVGSVPARTAPAPSGVKVVSRSGAVLGTGTVLVEKIVSQPFLRDGSGREAVAPGPLRVRHTCRAPPIAA